MNALLEELRVQFKLKGSDKDEIRRELNLLRMEVHPDKNGGEFKDFDDKKLFNSLNEAIEKIDDHGKNNTALISVREVTDLIKIVSDLVPSTQKNAIEQSINDKIVYSLDNYNKRAFLPKIGLTAITAIVTFIFLFPKTVSEHPILKYYLRPDDTSFAIIWLYTLFITCFFWFFIYRREEKAKHFMNSLKTDRVQNSIFNNFTRSEVITENQFDKDQLTLFILREYNRNSRNPMSRSLNILIGGTLIDEDLAQNISEIIIAKAISKKIILRNETDTDITDSYLLTQKNET